MNDKLKSRKLWFALALIVGAGFLNHGGTLSGAELSEFVQWIFGLYVAGNVGAKFGVGNGNKLP